MSNPLDRDLGPLLCAPKSVRNDQRVQELIEEIHELIAKPVFPRSSPTAPVDGGVPRSLEPTLIPEVMSVPRRRSHVGMLLYFLLGVAAIATPFPASKFPIEGIATAEERSNETPSFDTRFWEQDSKIAERQRPQSPQLSVNPGTPHNRGEAYPLAAAVTGSVIGASVVVDGLVEGSTLTAGLPLGANAWRLAASDLPNALVRPPEGFVGAMDVVLELRLVDDTVSDRRPLRLEWASGAPKRSTGYPIRQLDREETADLIGRGEKFIKAGDLASARLVLQRAAEAGDQRAALMLAGTFDPIMLEKIGIQGFAPDIIRGFAPDIALARTWYERAKEFGSREAVRRLQMLASRRGF